MSYHAFWNMEYEMKGASRGDMVGDFRFLDRVRFTDVSVSMYTYDNERLAISKLVEVSYSEHVVTTHCNRPRQKKFAETKVVAYLMTNNFPVWHFDPQ